MKEQVADVDLEETLGGKDPVYDSRFPNQNQAKTCFQNYSDYQKCTAVKVNYTFPLDQSPFSVEQRVEQNKTMII